jgi:uncharacterized membrane protein YfcA
MTYLAAFVAMLAYDYVWAKYAMATADRRIGMACGTAAMMPLFICFFSRSYVEDWKTAVPAALGAAIGTWIAMKWEKR